MTAPNAKTGEDKIVKPVKSIHIVVFACPNCGEEVEELKLCKECKSPMKVVQVIEKFGQEAEEYLAQLKKEGVWTDEYVSPSRNKYINDDGISVEDVDELDIPINGLHSKVADVEEDITGGLTDIFPSGDDDTATPKDAAGGIDMDLMDALDKLDEEDDNDVPENLPEL